MAEGDPEREMRVHRVFETLRTLRVDVSPDFVGRLMQRINRMPRIQGPRLGRVGGGLFKQLANLVFGSLNDPQDPPEDRE
ncbi:MAG: hypothetical protein ACI9OJ_001721 [Myxococcota bacterium]|jgi:hypothetical protein